MKQYKQTGFTLIEVLVSVFVLALGVIGAAGMQLTAMSTSQQSGSQTLALQLATELAENMRMNAGQMVQPPATNLYLSATGVGPSHSPGAAIPAPAVLCNGPGNSCTSAQLALFDIYEWKRRVAGTNYGTNKAGTLPNGKVVVCRDSQPFIAGAMTWTCTASANAPIVIKMGWHGNDKDYVDVPRVVVPVETYLAQ